MGTWQSMPFVRLLISLTSGIFIAFYYLKTYAWWALLIFIVVLLAYVILVFALPKSKRHFFEPLMGAFAFSGIFCTGILLTQAHQPEYDPHHILHLPEDYYDIIGKVTGTPIAPILEIEQIKYNEYWVTVKGKAILRFSQRLPKPTMAHGNKVLLLHQRLDIILLPLNPFQFNYKRYMYLQGVTHQLYVNNSKIHIIDKGGISKIKQLAFWIRNNSEDIIKNNVRSQEVYGLVTALILGNRAYLEQEIKDSYRVAGVTHVLAVSGLHVGFIYLLLVMSLGRLRVKYKFLFLVIVLLVLWLYALVTGFSGSVLRAVTMFSIITIAQNIGRNSNMYNTLAVSAFFILIFQPFLLIDVGFQLSYIAVWGIVYLYPRIYQWFQIKWKLLDWIWQLTAISIAAQVFTLPLVLYYFHQYPNYSLLANLFIVPLGNLILFLGLALLLLFWLPGLNYGLGYLLKGTVQVSNWITRFISQWPGAQTEWYINITETLLIIIFIGSALAFFQAKKIIWLYMSILFMAGLCIINIYHRHHNHFREALIVYNITGKHEAIGIVKGNTITFLQQNNTIVPKVLEYATREHLKAWSIRKKLFIPLEKTTAKSGNFYLLIWHNKRIVIIAKKLSTTEWAALKRLNPDFCIVRNNALNSLKHISGTRVSFIFDASNNKQIVEKLIRQLPRAHSTQHHGAWMLQ